MLKSLKSRDHILSSPQNQLDFLNNGIFGSGRLRTFQESLKSQSNWPLTSKKLEILQVNIGYMCNQTCKHCHVDAGPDRKEIMTREVMSNCLDVIRKGQIKTLDITGGAPEMNPNFRWFVEEASRIGISEIIVRSNLTIIMSNPAYHDLPDFFARHNVRIVSSLPYYKKLKTDRQRGNGVFNKSIDALTKLNEAGYGLPHSNLKLDLVYNPSGAFLSGEQTELERDFKNALHTHHGIQFNSLLTITNLPISRFLEYLVDSDNYEEYMEKLVQAYNPSTVENLMCRNTISVDWQGYIYDCDFNQMLELKVEAEAGQHISDFDMERIESRKIQVNQHCFGCTAGAGSSCQGAIAESN
ncbi:MAG: radical SAM protein [Crocinitomicaceae bacterium]|nr:radical SAM protein [Crocinitomicaceae bacterium]